MCQSTTPGRAGQARAPAVVCLFILATLPAFPQAGADVRLLLPEWRRIGNTTLEMDLAGPASGKVDRVWYSAGGDGLFVLTAAGRILQTTDFERWEAAGPQAVPPLPAETEAAGPPEPGARLTSGRRGGLVVYGWGRSVHRSDDGGRAWTNLTLFRGESLIGDVNDVAVSPAEENEIAVASDQGVWRSLDGGRSWSSLNEGFPNLAARRLLSLPGDGHGLRLLVEDAGVFEWAPGQRLAWQPADAPELAREAVLRAVVGAVVGEPIRSVAASGDWLYAGSASAGRLWVSSDAGRSWRPFEVPGAGPVQRIFVASQSPTVALAALGSGSDSESRNVQVLRTTNGGIFWDDLTANLPAAPAHAITADVATGAVYVGTARGAFLTIADLNGAGRPTPWVSVTRNFGDPAVYDVRLDEAGNQIYLAVDGDGVYAATAPHRFLAPAIVNAADRRARAASPGVLLSVLGGKVETATAGAVNVPVLASSNQESQIQVPFEVAGGSLSLALLTTGADGPARLTLGLPLFPAAPAIFEDRDGAPMVLDADSGVILDAMRPARPGDRIQILATGLGRTEPPWPTGLPAPLQDPPSVATAVGVYLDRQRVEPLRATLAPGYVGFYLIEFEVPQIVNAGPAELFLEAGGLESNRTRIYLAP